MECQHKFENIGMSRSRFLWKWKSVIYQKCTKCGRIKSETFNEYLEPEAFGIVKY